MVFRATPVGDATDIAQLEDDGPSIGWFAALPNGFGDCGGPAVDDARLFVE